MMGEMEKVDERMLCGIELVVGLMFGSVVENSMESTGMGGNEIQRSACIFEGVGFVDGHGVVCCF